MPNILRLTWTTRVRGEGAGIGDPDTVVDAEPTWEGLFELQVWVGGTLVATITGINDDRYTFTMAQLQTYSTLAGCSDAPCLPEILGFKLRGYRVTGGITFYTDWRTLRVRVKAGTAGACTGCGSATTTTTTTSTTTSTSTSTSTSSSTSSTTTTS